MEQGRIGVGAHGDVAWQRLIHDNALVRRGDASQAWLHVAASSQSHNTLVETEEIGYLQQPATSNVNDTVATGTSNQDAGTANAGPAIGGMLLGCVAFIMTMFYGVNWPDPDIRHATWKTMSHTSSIFCAVLIFHAFKDVLECELGETADEEDGPKVHMLAISLFVSSSCL
jgi:hypothetical protein